MYTRDKQLYVDLNQELILTLMKMGNTYIFSCITHAKLTFLYKNIHIDQQNSVFLPRKGTLKYSFYSSMF